MKIKKPALVINMKNFPHIYSDKSIELANEIIEIRKNSPIEIILCPPSPMLSSVSKLNLPVFAQHVDYQKEGSSTGAIIPELLNQLSIRGSLINHSEKRIPFDEINRSVERLKNLSMISLVCARTPDEVATISKFKPDMIAIEPPELIGSGRAVSKVNPSIITDSINAAKDVDSNVDLLCGAGIVTAEDVEIALELGAQGILIASGVIKAENWTEKINELCAPFNKWY